MSNSSNRNNNNRPLHPASSGTETDFTPTSNPLNLTTPSSKRTTPSIGPSPAQTLHATPSNKNIAPVGQTQAISAPQGNQGKPLLQNKATSTSDQLTPKRENQVASSETASAENGNAKRTPLPKRTAAPADLFSGDNVVDDDAASNTKVNGVKDQQDDIKMTKTTTPPSTATKRKAAEEIPRARDDDGKEDDRSASGNTLARNEEEEEPFDPTAPVVKINTQADLVDRWDAIQAEMAPDLKKWAEATIGNTFTMVYSVVHIFHLMNKSAQEELREGVADIEAEEAKQEQFRRRIMEFSAEMEKVASSLRLFPSFGDM